MYVSISCEIETYIQKILFSGFIHTSSECEIHICNTEAI